MTGKWQHMLKALLRGGCVRDRFNIDPTLARVSGCRGPPPLQAELRICIQRSVQGRSQSTSSGCHSVRINLSALAEGVKTPTMRALN